MGTFYSENDYRHYLVHHGVKGMKWGVCHERQSTGNRGAKSKVSGASSKKGLQLTDKQKRLVKMGVAVAVAGIAAYGGYKLYQNGIGNRPLRKPSGDASTFKFLPNGSETLSETLSKANPLRGTPEGKNNCVNSAIAGYMRHSLGMDVVAGSSGGKQQIMGGAIEECFRGARILDGTAVKFGKSPKDAAEMLLKKYGNNASGLVSIQWKSNSPLTGGHTFSWDIQDGIVKFRDYQQGKDNSYVERYWQYIDPNDSLTIARLDTAEIIPDKIIQYVKN